MADPLSVSAGVVGIVVPALHGIRLLLNDIKGLKSAPTSLKRLQTDLEATERAHQSLQLVLAKDLQFLGQDVATQIKLAVESCKEACLEFHQRLRSLTKHSGNGEISWRDRTNIAFFAANDVATMSAQLQAVKLTFTSVVSLGSLNMVFRNAQIAEETRSVIENNRGRQGIALRDCIMVLPFRRDYDFIDRPEMSNLVERMSSDTARVALVGLGGVGKSQLAIEYCFRRREIEHDVSILWIHAGDTARYIESLCDIAKHARLDFSRESPLTILKTIHDWLQHEVNGKWVIVLDGLDNAEYLSLPLAESLHIMTDASSSTLQKCISDYIPTYKGGNVLITTRSRGAAATMVDNKDIIVVSTMEEETAAILLAQKSGEKVSEAIRGLAVELNHIPLAMVQAAAYIQKMAPIVTAERLLQDLRSRQRTKEDLLTAEVKLDLRRDKDATNSVVLTWWIVFEQIKSQRPSAASLLGLLSFFDYDSIPTTIFRHLRVRKEPMEGVYIPDIDLELDFCLLQDFMLIKIDPDAQGLRMHELVQLAIREWLRTKNDTFSKRLSQALEILNKNLLDGEFENWTSCMTIFPHAMKILELEELDDTVHLEHLIGLVHKATWFALNRGFAQQIRRLHAKASQIESKISGSQDMESITTNAATLAALLEEQGQFQEAEQRRVLVWDILRVKYGDTHSRTWIALSNLAAVYSMLGRWDEARKAHQQVGKLRAEKLGPKHPDTLISLSNLASVYFKQGDFSAAKRLYQQVFDARQEVLAEEHPDTISSMANIAAACFELGEWNEAEKLNTTVVMSRIKVLGSFHQDTLLAQSNLAQGLAKQARWEEAEALQEKILEACQTQLGMQHPATVQNMANLAVTYGELGRHEQEEQLERQVLAARESALPEDHPDRLLAIANLAATLQELDRLDEAEALAMQALKIRERTLGLTHPATLTSKSTMAKIHRDRGQYDAAAELDTAVLDARRQIFGDHHPTTTTAMCLLAVSRRWQGRLEEAEKLAHEAISTGESVLGPEHPYQLIAVANLAETYRRQGRIEEARTLQERVVKFRTQKLGPKHPDTIASVKRLTLLTEAKDGPQESGTLQEAAVQSHGKQSVVDVLGQEK